ncbi:MAG: UDP-glucose dehydrogenase family protein [Burkholderiales bacterium]
MSEHITIIGTGYVGLVTGACLAEMGHYVTCFDIDDYVISKLNKGIILNYEPGLDKLVISNKKSERLYFTNDIEKAINFGNIIFIAVDTPSREDGGVDLSRVFSAVASITTHMKDDKIIVIKSTSPVDTYEYIHNYMKQNLDMRHSKIGFSIACNPEFLREGNAISDFMNPDRIVIGTRDEKTAQIICKVYKPLIDNGVKCIITDPKSATLIKYASNAFLALKLSFINEISNLCECIGANIDDVSYGIGLDKRIGPQFLKPGPGFGGSCFPKDMKALVHMGNQYNIDISVISTAIESNHLQKIRAAKKIEQVVGGTNGKIIAVLGTAFKAETDDIRESPAIEIVKYLISRNAQVRIYDPKAMEKTKKVFNDLVYYAEDEYDAAKNADAVVILTDWKQFASISLDRMARIIRNKIIIDFRAILKHLDFNKYDFSYYCIGRSEGERA